MNIFETLALYLSYPFVRYALIIGVLVSLCAAVIGVPLVLKRFSYIGDGLSHVAFFAMTVGIIMGLTDEMLLVLPITVAAAIFILNGSENRKVKGDASIAMLSTGALALGYLLMNVFSKSANLTGDVCSTLFGSTSILTLSFSDVILTVVLSAVCIAVYVVMYSRIFAVTFDESFAHASGVSAKTVNLITSVITAVIIVLAMNLVGSLLIAALIIFPAITAMRLCTSFRSVTVCAAILAVSCALFGILASIVAGTPVGSTIVVTQIIVYFAVFLITSLKGKAA